MKLQRTTVLAAIVLAFAGSVHAEVSADEAKQLGTTLTPMGATLAGNRDSSIPAYTGGLTTLPPGFDPKSKKTIDPYASDKPLLTITAQNLASHADKLSDGVKSMFAKYPNFRVIVYPTRRSAAFPKEVQQTTIANATRCKEVGESVVNCAGGLPFPIPKNGTQAVWNHYLAFSVPGGMVQDGYQSYVVDAAGNAVLMARSTIWSDFQYYYPENRNKASVSYFTRYRSDTVAPARSVGEKILVLYPADLAQGSKVYQYVPGQRRVKLSPDLDYDTPNPQSGGSAGMDDTAAFSGRMDRYDFKLIGKKELYIPYNNHKFYFDETCGVKSLTKNFINPDCVRFELHRVWVVEATLKPGLRHAYAKRMMYWDEDSWRGMVDNYDASGKVYRSIWQLPFPLYQFGDVASLHPGSFNSFDLQTGSYGAFGMMDRTRLEILPDREYKPEAMTGSGVR